jgi:hypothetical protein
MKKLTISLFLLQSLALMAQQKPLTKNTADGRLTLSDAGASYFAKISLDCTGKPYPHYYMERLQTAEELKSPDKLWPSFYGCFDWHSGVHNHWALVKLLKKFPNIPEAAAIKQKLELSFNAKNILAETEYLVKHQEDEFEFPYGTSWLLKVVDELNNWNNPKAKEWAKNLQPLVAYITKRYMLLWPNIEKANYSGDHYASSLGLSLALDYARSAKNDSLEAILVTAAKNYYGDVINFPLVKEPFGYDFMSAGLLITDLMRKILPKAEYETWLKKFSPELFTTTGVAKVFKVKETDDHTGFEAHWDGFHLNRIWCINGMFKSLSPTALATDVRKAWIDAQKKMWDYAQKSIGVGNYDEDHWLSSFSVFALIGYDD